MSRTLMLLAIAAACLAGPLTCGCRGPGPPATVSADTLKGGAIPADAQRKMQSAQDAAKGGR